MTLTRTETLSLFITVMGIVLAVVTGGFSG